ncbi:MAG: electron transfer flavoprotein subunit alpha/FixB family protein [Myxococcota bacterium]|nr:electron transfer flavoprotein subunit alpha/FixB family protein [Myxococcota bacterium]
MGNGILVICEHDGGSFKKTAFELLGKANDLASGNVSALVVGAADGASLGAHGASKVYTVAGDGFGGNDVASMVAAVQAAIAAADPAVVLASASPQAKAYLPRLAARLGLGLGAECTDLRAEGGAIVGRRPMYAGKAFADVNISSSPAIFTVRPNSFPVTAGAGGAAEVVDVAAAAPELVARIVGREDASSSVADLTEADRIVSGGRSVKSAENYDSVIRPLAASIGATPGASRAAVDAGYAPHSHQVGQTGKVVNPSLYVAMGISGAIQHLAGMRTSRVIVAVNTDAEAAIFQHATYGIVGDLFAVGPLLQQELEALD